MEEEGGKILSKEYKDMMDEEVKIALERMEMYARDHGVVPPPLPTEYVLRAERESAVQVEKGWFDGVEFAFPDLRLPFVCLVFLYLSSNLFEHYSGA